MGKTKVPAIPAPTDSNLREVARAVKGVIDVREGLTGDPLDAAVTFRDLQDGGVIDVTTIGSRTLSISSTGGTGTGTATPGGYDPTTDLTPPPAPTGVVATAGLAVVILEWTAPTYTNHAFAEIWRSATDVIGNAVRVGTSVANIYNDALGSTGVTRYYWIRFRSEADITGPYNATSGTVATTGKIGNVDLGPLIIEAGNLASGAVTATKLATAAIDATKFANSIEPVTLVTSVPSVKSTSTIFNSTDGKLYRWNGTSYVATVPTADLSGTISDAQVAGLAASKVTGQLSDTQLAAIAATKITGTISNAQIADSALTAAKFAIGVEPVTVVTSVPGTKSTSTVFNSTDGKLYRWNGTSYISSVPAGDLSGQIGTTQLVDSAITSVKIAAGQVTAAKTSIAAIDATTGNLTANSVTANAILAGEVTAGKLATDSVVAANIQAGAITTAKMTANTIDGAVITAGTLAAAKLVANSITAGQIASGTITGDRIAGTTIAGTNLIGGTITATQIASGTITGDRIAGTTIAGSNIIGGTITAGQIATGTITAANILGGTITGGKIASGTIEALNIAGSTITGDKIAGQTITATNIAAETITAGQIQAGAIGASQIAAGAITTAKLLVTGRGKALNDDPTFQDASAWSQGGGVGSYFLGAESTSPVGTQILRATSGVQFRARSFPITAGAQYKVAMWARMTSGTGLMYLRLYCYNSAGALINYIVTGLTPTTNGLEGLTVPTTWTKYVGYITAGAATVTGILIVHVNWNTTGVTDVADCRVEEYIGADLIVDGAISANKIAANAIAVGTAAIQNGAIVNAMLGNAIIDNAKIADAAITTAKIGDAQITNVKISGTIQSDNYSAGSAGWAINKATGAAEFAAGVIRGTLTASQIDSRGLSIKDTNGNIILAAGSPLAAANVTADPGWLNSNVTATGLGAVKTDLTNAPAGILNSNVTATGIGAVKTDLTNAPAGVLNSNVSISSSGTLSGAGGGTVTIGGMDNTVVRSANPITAANVSTYIASAAIGSAYIGTLTASNLTVSAISNTINGSLSSGGRVEVANNVIRVYDASNALRVKLGYLL